MKISNEESLRASRIDSIAPIQSGSVKVQPAVTPGSGPAAQVELSEHAKSLAAVKAEAARYLPAVQAAPETRDDLVARLKTQVESGKYHVPAADIADQITRRAKADSVR